MAPRSPKAIVEEYEGNEATGVEAEETEPAEGSVAIPYDPTKIRVDPKTYSLRQIADMIRDGDLDIAPDFQRKKVWKQREKSRLIESILLRIPLPAFYFTSDTDGLLRVVDGLQRLSTVDDYMAGKFALSQLEYLTDANGKRYEDLEATWKRRIMQTQIYANVIDPQTPTQVKFDIFRRLNTGGSPLNSQEIRHCMSGPKCRALLKALTGGYLDRDTWTPLSFAKVDLQDELSESTYKAACAAGLAFAEATGWALWDHVRMADREVILRFLAFNSIEKSIEKYGAFRSMDDFLTDATESIESQMSEKQISNQAKLLSRAMANAAEVFGESAFRKPNPASSRSNPINRALFETWGVALARYPESRVRLKKSKILRAAEKALTNDEDYISSISAGTGDKNKVYYRFRVARDILNTCMK